MAGRFPSEESSAILLIKESAWAIGAKRDAVFEIPKKILAFHLIRNFHCGSNRRLYILVINKK